MGKINPDAHATCGLPWPSSSSSPLSFWRVAVVFIEVVVPSDFHNFRDAAKTSHHCQLSLGEVQTPRSSTVQYSHDQVAQRSVFFRIV